MAEPLTGAEVLALLPQQEQFRFVDEILEVDEDHIVSRYTFRPDADFYRGHFPGNPITPGVLLIEAMAQTGVVALGIYLVARERGLEEVRRVLTVFTDVTAEFSGVVAEVASMVASGEALVRQHAPTAPTEVAALPASHQEAPEAPRASAGRRGTASNAARK